MNWIFLGLIAVSVLVAAFNGNMALVFQESIDSSKAAVRLSIELVGQMTLWLGLMGVLRDAGLMRSVANALRPVMVRLFPQVPPDHPAMGAMIMNIAANMLGLGNAATPFGLKAMSELDKLNTRKGVATNAMALFLVINTSGLAVLPLGVVAIRATLGSRDPGGIVVPSLLGTFISTVLAILVAKAFERVPAFGADRYPATEPSPPADGKPAVSDQALAEAEKTAAPVPPARGWRLVVALAVVAALGFGAYRYGRAPCASAAQCGVDQLCRQGTCLATADPCASVPACPNGQVCREGKCAAVPCSAAKACAGVEECRPADAGPVCHERDGALGSTVRSVLSLWLLPVLMLGILLFAMGRRVKVYEAFIPAAKEGFQIAVTIIPFLVAILVAVGMFRASGALHGLVGVLGHATNLVGLPPQALPMALVRPLSGSGAMGVLMDTLRAEGPDSFVGYLVSLLNGSSETTFYVLALYFGSIQVRAVRHTLPACLTSDLIGIAVTVVLTHLFFG